MKSINILACANGVGISRDIAIIQDVLSRADFNVEVNNPFRPVVNKKYDLNIFLERFNTPWFAAANKNVMIPNQEWFEPAWLPQLKRFDVIFTKTRFADAVFKSLKCKTEFISFTSDDRFLPDIKKDEFSWIHVVGKSIQKQTDIVYRTWERNPGFPQLTIIHDPKFYKPRPVLRNINYMYCRVPEQLLKVMQNTANVHVCPSETEGFGHYIMEAMSCQGVVLTTDAPPMNEFITPERGAFVKPIHQEPMRLSTKFIISEDVLEKAVINLTVIPGQTQRQMGQAAREFFLNNDLFFRSRLLESVNGILA